MKWIIVAFAGCLPVCMTSCVTGAAGVAAAAIPLIPIIQDLISQVAAE